MICFRGEQSWRLPSYKVKQFYFTAEDPGSAVIRVYDEAGNVIETHEHAGEFKEWELLRHCIHCELVNCRFQFQERSQQFIRANDETFPSRSATADCASGINAEHSEL